MCRYSASNSTSRHRARSMGSNLDTLGRVKSQELPETHAISYYHDVVPDLNQSSSPSSTLPPNNLTPLQNKYNSNPAQALHMFQLNNNYSIPSGALESSPTEEPPGPSGLTDTDSVSEHDDSLSSHPHDALGRLSRTRSLSSTASQSDPFFQSSTSPHIPPFRTRSRGYSGHSNLSNHSNSPVPAAPHFELYGRNSSTEISVPEISRPTLGNEDRSLSESPPGLFVHVGSDNSYGSGNSFTGFTSPLTSGHHYPAAGSMNSQGSQLGSAELSGSPDYHKDVPHHKKHLSFNSRGRDHSPGNFKSPIQSNSRPPQLLDKTPQSKPKEPQHTRWSVLASPSMTRTAITVSGMEVSPLPLSIYIFSHALYTSLDL